MATYKAFTLEEIEELKSKSQNLIKDKREIEEIKKTISIYEDGIRTLNEEIKTIEKKYKSIYSDKIDMNLTDYSIFLHLYGINDNHMINMRIKQINDDNSIIFVGSYHYGQYSLEIVVPDYREFINNGYYKGTTKEYRYNKEDNFILANVYTPEIVKEIIYMYLNDELESKKNDLNYYNEQKRKFEDGVNKVSKLIKGFEDVKDSKILELYKCMDFPVSGCVSKEELLNAMPRKVCILKENNKEEKED